MGYIDYAAERPRPAEDCVVYLDHAATTPMLPEALAAMTEELGQLGNPSSLHNAGRRARRVVEESREQIAEVFGARPSEVIFTSGGTEADNLAVKGLYWARRAAGAGRPAASQSGPGQPGSLPRRVLATAIEHHAVLDSVHWLACDEDAEEHWLPVDETGVLQPAALAEAIAADPDGVALVTVMWANNEVGAVQPIPELAALAREHGIPFHTDAVQAAGQLPVDFAASGADAMTITGHKFGGPVGAGALLLARGVQPVPVLHGGGQESEVRSGTLDAPAIRRVRGRGGGHGQSPGGGGGPAGQAPRRPDRPGARGGAGRHPQRPARRAGAAARQRALLLPRLRGRRAAHAARRQGHRLLDGLGLHRRRGPAQPRAAGHGGGRGPVPRVTAVLPGPHLHRRTTWTRWARPSGRPCSGPGAPPR